MSQFINERDDIVTEAIDGLLRGAADLTRLDGYPHIKVVLRSDWDKSRVALVSGGGSGHEPAHAGFVGRGMLTAAVCGDVFASPSVEAVLAGILAVTGPAGCLLIVKNYTGDRLNFGLAAERARAMGHKVAMVVVDDDIALPHLPQPRGVAGTLFVHKIAGALAEVGEDLTAVAAAAERVRGSIASIGMSLTTCMVPGSPREDRIATGMAELGLGIHGEPGVEQIAHDGARAAMQTVAARLLPKMGDGDHVALINNLGGTTPLEMAILTEELARAEIGARISHVIGPASMMTSLDMRGFSVSLLPMSGDQEPLALPVAPAAWPKMQRLRDVPMAPMPEGLDLQEFKPTEQPARRDLIARCCGILTDAEAALNALDAKSGDGDTGSTLAVAARAVLARLDQLPLADDTDLCRAIAQELGQAMGGSSGVLMAIYFAAAGDGFSKGDTPVGALKAGLDRVKKVGGADIGDRTMIDALAPALDALGEGLPAAAQAARAGADGTASITTAKAGRAAYVAADNLRGHNDPGAEAIALVFEGLTRA